nr:penicillin acylase family protein [Dehalococcoidia bacterium]
EMMLGQVAYMFGEKKALELWPVAPDESPESLPTVAFDLAPVWEAMSVADEKIRRLLGTAGGHLGSNSWVVSGARTKSGKPILSNDPHLGMTQPSIWYEMHLVGGKYDVSGVCFPGTPFVILGQNRNAAWGFTNLMTDDLDFYVEKVNPDNSNQYYYDGIWKEMILRDEQIPVKGGKTQTLLVRETHRGPVISDLHPLAKGGDRVISFRWTGRDMSDEVDAFLRLNTMENWRDFSEAVSRFTVPGQNIIYADTKGNIGWRPAVRIPKRKGGETLVPLPGETSEYDWKGFVKSSAMPRLFNPPTGIIATANHRTIPDNSPYYVSSLWHEKSRHDRISELLDGRSNLTVDDMTAIQQDVVSPFGQDIAPYFIKAFENETVEEGSNLQYAINVLGEWAGGFEPESVGGLIFSTVMLELLEAVYIDEMALLGDDFFLAWIGPVGARGNWAISLRNLRGILERGGSSWVDDVRTPNQVENLDEIIRRAFRSAVAELETRLGPSPGNWWWGRLHILTHVHTIGGAKPLLDRLFGFNVGPFESGGSSTTINNGEYTLSAPFQRVVGPSFRRIVDLSDLNSTQFVLPTGQSGLPRSPHYADQASLYMSGRYRTTLIDEATIRNSGFQKLVLKPSVQ